MNKKLEYNDGASVLGLANFFILANFIHIKVRNNSKKQETE